MSVDPLLDLDRSRRLFLHHEHFLYYLSMVAVLLVAWHSHALVVNVGVPLMVVLLTLPFALTRLQQGYQRNRRAEDFNNLLSLLDALLTALAIAAIEFLPTPSLALLGMLVLRLTGRVSLWQAMTAVLGGLVVVSVLAAGLGQEVLPNQRAPLLLVGTSLLALVVMAVVDILHVEAQLAQSQVKIEASRRDAHQFMQLANKVSRYAPAQVWQSMLRGERDVRIDNKRRRLTIFFSDIEGFTALSEELTADDLAELLNDYFERMTEIANRFGGTVDKFIGDGLLIFFGDPDSRGEAKDALACVEMALAMRQEVQVMQVEWASNGREGLGVRMGIATGHCHVGNFGSISRLSYTVIGREANRAARLQAVAATNEIVISDATHQLVREHIRCRDRGVVELKGFSQAVHCWTVVEPLQHGDESMRRWHEVSLDGFRLQLDLARVAEHDVERILRALHQADVAVKQQAIQGGQGGSVVDAPTL